MQHCTLPDATSTGDRRSPPNLRSHRRSSDVGCTRCLADKMGMSFVDRPQRTIGGAAPEVLRGVAHNVVPKWSLTTRSWTRNGSRGDLARTAPEPTGSASTFAAFRVGGVVHVGAAARPVGLHWRLLGEARPAPTHEDMEDDGTAKPARRSNCAATSRMRATTASTRTK